MNPRGERARRMLDGLAKLGAVIIIAGGAGSVIGFGLSKLTSDDSAEPEPGVTSTERADPVATTGGPARGPRGSRPVGVVVDVPDAVVHPAGTASGRARNRARLTVRVRVRNTSTGVLTPARPAVLIGASRTPADPNADAPGTRLGSIAPGAAAAATLRFEVGGAAGAKLMTERRARVVVAGLTRPISVKLGNPVRSQAPAE